MSESELKPCPFCGDKARVKKHQHTYTPDDLYKIMCSKCHATIPWRNNPNEAIELWNMRA